MGHDFCYNTANYCFSDWKDTGVETMAGAPAGSTACAGGPLCLQTPGLLMWGLLEIYLLGFCQVLIAANREKPPLTRWWREREAFKTVTE